MTAITQSIPNFSHGISQQPDYLKRPGQVRDLVNGLPDVTQGLLKRPGGRRIGTLDTTSGGKWFTIYRDEDEQYIVQYKDGLFRVWSLLDGLPRAVNYTDKPSSDHIKVDDGDPNAGLAQCDNVALEQATQAYRVAKWNVDHIWNQIWSLEHQINELTRNYYSATGTEVYYQDKKIGKNAYELTLGHVVMKIPKGRTLDVNKPWPLPTNKKIRVGKKRHNNVNIKLPPGVWPAGTVNFVTGDVYEYIVEWTSPASDPREPLRNQIASLKGQLAGLEANLVAAREAYELKALPCGITAYPVVRRTNNVPVVPDYLADTDPKDIEVLTINDYTFISNRNRKVVMGADKSQLRPYEAFVSINTLAANSNYSIDLSWTDNPTTSTVTRATKLNVSPSSWKHDDGNPKYTDTKEFTESHGAGKDLRFTLETRGQSVPKSNKDPSKGYRSEYTTTITLLHGGLGWNVGDVFTVRMSGKDYKVTVAATSSEVTYSSATGGTPVEAITPTTGVISISTLLNNLKAGIEAQSFGIQATIIGSGLYITSAKAFTIKTRAASYMTAFTNEVANIAKLPIECKNGYIVKINNSGEKEDDYWVQFKGRQGNDGVGVWEETIRPGIETSFSYSSMPHQLRRLADGTFEFGPVDWEMRLVGDNTTNPKPSFVGKSINKMFFFRNRLGLSSDENVILSRAGDYFNFWSKTALTVQPSDPIDISSSSTYPAILYDAVPFMQGVVLFSPTQQFLLTTDQDVFGPETAKLILTSTFRDSIELPAFNLGTTVGFINKTGKYSRFMEMSNINRQSPPELIEQSKIISEMIPSTINCLADSRESDILMLGTSSVDGSVASNRVYGYRYFNDGEKRIQSAWFKWDLSGELEHHAILGDSYYTVTQHNTTDGPKLYLYQYDLNPKVESAYISDSFGIEYPVSLDNYTMVSPIGISYDKTTNDSKFELPWPHEPSRTVVAFAIGSGEKQGWLSYPKIKLENGKHYCHMDGVWTDTTIVVGYDYEMKVVVPNIYLSKDESTSNRVVADTRSSLMINRMKFRFGESGTFVTTVKRKGREDYTELWETRPSDSYDADTHSVAAERALTVPVYERNTNVTVELTSKHPTPATLFSLDWEGNYTNMYYRRV